MQPGRGHQCWTAGVLRHFHEPERTALAYEVWREDYLEQVAVSRVLACVLVPFPEDNRLVDECLRAGEGDRRKLAEGNYDLNSREHPQGNRP